MNPSVKLMNLLYREELSFIDEHARDFDVTK